MGILKNYLSTRLFDPRSPEAGKEQSDAEQLRGEIQELKKQLIKEQGAREADAERMSALEALTEQTRERVAEVPDLVSEATTKIGNTLSGITEDIGLQYTKTVEGGSQLAGEVATTVSNITGTGLEKVQLHGRKMAKGLSEAPAVLSHVASDLSVIPSVAKREFEKGKGAVKTALHKGVTGLAKNLENQAQRSASAKTEQQPKVAENLADKLAKAATQVAENSVKTAQAAPKAAPKATPKEAPKTAAKAPVRTAGGKSEKLTA